MKYRSLIVRRRGGPDVLEIVENDLRPPSTARRRLTIKPRTFRAVRQSEPGGLDVVFDGKSLMRSFDLLKRGGQWVSYANPGSLRGMFTLLGKLFWLNLPHTGRKLRLYGTGASFLDMRPFQQDWATLFTWLGEGKIRPVIAAEFPLLEAAKANALLESGQVTGNVVLINQEPVL